MPPGLGQVFGELIIVHRIKDIALPWLFPREGILGDRIAHGLQHVAEENAFSQSRG